MGVSRLAARRDDHPDVGILFFVGRGSGVGGTYTESVGGTGGKKIHYNLALVIRAFPGIVFGHRKHGIETPIRFVELVYRCVIDVVYHRVRTLAAVGVIGSAFELHRYRTGFILKSVDRLDSLA